MKYYKEEREIRPVKESAIWAPIEDVIRIRTGESGEDAIGSMKADGK
mgnify:CR=1 FL=1